VAFTPPSSLALVLLQHEENLVGKEIKISLLDRKLIKAKCSQGYKQARVLVPLLRVFYYYVNEINCKQ
jgi:hypothetical protein